MKDALPTGISKRDAPHPASTVLIDVLHPATVLQQVHGGRRDFDDQIRALVEDMDTLKPK